MQAGSIDAGLLMAPVTLRAIKLGFKPFLDLGTLRFLYPNTVILASNKYLNRNRERTKLFLRAYLEGIQMMKNDKSYTMKVIAKYTRVEDEEAVAAVYEVFGRKYLESDPYPDPEIFVSALQFQSEAEAGGKKNLQPMEFVETSIMEELARERPGKEERGQKAP